MEKGSRYGRDFTLWFTGLSGDGKTTISGSIILSRSWVRVFHRLPASGRRGF
jgi:adenylylsulfate kinase-like enzyme